MATMQMSVRPEDLSQFSKGAERIPEPGVLVIFGASGDLTKRKLFPALFHLFQANLLPKQFAIVGVARRPLGDEFAADMRAGIVESGGVDATDAKLDSLRQPHQLFPAQLRRSIALRESEDRTRPHRRSRRESVPTGSITWPPRRSFLPASWRTWARRAWRSPEKGRAVVVIEKPFGHDLDSARELNHQVNAVFQESQVFRIDHYLGKETVQNLLVFRFANGIFEPIWKRNYIDNVQITVAETLGVEGRGPFYEKAGALRDVVQNHMMELLALVALEPPSSFEAESVRREKLKVWQAIPSIPILQTVRGQYGPGIVNGRARDRLSRRGTRQSRVRHRDLRRAPPHRRELALGGRSVLSARRQAHEEARHGNLHPVQAAAAFDLQSHGNCRPLPRDPAQPVDDPHPARRGHCAALRRQGSYRARRWRCAR